MSISLFDETTTEDASKRICPIQSLNGKPINCAHTRCMMWRWLYQSDTQGRIEDPQFGYCGLAAKPADRGAT